MAEKKPTVVTRAEFEAFINQTCLQFASFANKIVALQNQLDRVIDWSEASDATLKSMRDTNAELNTALRAALLLMPREDNRPLS